MIVAELPESELITCSADPLKLGAALSNILSGSLMVSYGYKANIEGGEDSIYILSPRPTMNDIALIKLQKAFPPMAMALELIKDWRFKTLYNPPVNPAMEKGWGIRSVTVDEGPIAIIRAVWVSALPPIKPYF